MTTEREKEELSLCCDDVNFCTLTCYFSLGQVLRVPLLASGHRPGIYTGIARRAALEGSALLLLLLLYTGRKLAPKPAAR